METSDVLSSYGGGGGAPPVNRSRRMSMTANAEDMEIELPGNQTLGSMGQDSKMQ